MLRYLPIRKIHGRQVLDSRGNPTVEVEVTVGEGVVGMNGYTERVIVPSGASTGKYEAVEIRDHDEKKYNGLSVLKAVENVNTIIAENIIGENALDQINIDYILSELDGTENKRNLGANAILGVSLAVAKATASALRIPLSQYLGGCNVKKFPVPMMNILNGGVHAENTIDFQEFMIMPVGAANIFEATRICTEIYYKLREILRGKNMTTAVGDEGGFAPNISSTEEALEILLDSISKAGYEAGKEILIAIDAASSELFNEDEKIYYFPGESKMKKRDIIRDTNEMIKYYEKLISEYPIISIEDGLAEDDWDGWKRLTNKLGKKVQLVGDDLFVTNKKRLLYGIKNNIANAILIKVNQIGTLTEAIDSVKIAQRAGYNTIISHRSGESEDSFIADLALAVDAGQIKTGAPCRAERTAKYNQLLRIADSKKDNMIYENPFA